VTLGQKHSDAGRWFWLYVGGAFFRPSRRSSSLGT
jgi:hypothetical protein